MTIHLPEDLTHSVRAEVLSGHFASEDEMVAAAVRDYLQRRQEQGHRTDEAAAELPLITAEEMNSQQLQRRLLEAGIIGEIKPPITDPAPYRNRRAVPIQGEPLSETVLRERR